MSLTTTEFDRLCAREAHDGLSEGIQFYVSVGGRVLLDGAYGKAAPGEAMTPLSISQSFCLTKPLLAVVLGMLHDRGVADLDSSVGPWSMPVVDLLNHRAGLTTPGAADLLFAPPSSFDVSIGSATPGPPGYSEYVSWHLLMVWATQSVGCEFVRFCDELVFPSWNLNSTFYVSRQDMWSVVADRLAVWYLREADGNVPLLHQRLRKYLTDPSFAPVGAYTTARDVGAFYDRIALVLRGTNQYMLPRVDTMKRLTTTSTTSFDARFERECSYGLGFMTDLESHEFGSTLSKFAFGHAGYLGTSFGLHDPASETTVVVVCNTIGVRPFEGAVSFRIELLEALARVGSAAHGDLQ